MAAKTMRVEHSKLGEFMFITNNEGRLVYDYETISAIFAKGIEFLFDRGLLSESEKKVASARTGFFEVVFTSDPIIEIQCSYEYIKLTGHASLDAITVNRNTEYFDVTRMIDSFLEVLCRTIEVVLTKFGSVETLKNRGNPELQVGMEYAAALGLQDSIFAKMFYNRAMEYLTKEATIDEIEKLKEILVSYKDDGDKEIDKIDEDNLFHIFASDYEEVVMSDLDDDIESAFSPKEYIADKISIHEMDKRNNE